MSLDVTRLSQEMCTLDPDNPSSFELWGKLVKTWVTGNNQFNDGNDYSIPASKDSLKPLGAMTKEQFQGMLSNAGVVMTIPDKVKTFVFVQDDESTVIVRVPSKKVVEGIQGQLEALAGAGAEAPYPLPKFYTDNWPPSVQHSLNEVQMMTMHCQRIGEYTINTCG
jgi:hypothetical protein